MKSLQSMTSWMMEAALAAATHRNDAAVCLTSGFHVFQSSAETDTIPYPCSQLTDPPKPFAADISVYVPIYTTRRRHSFPGMSAVSSASNCHRLRYAEVPGHLHCDKDPSLGCRSQLFCRQPTSLEQSITWAESWTGEFNRLLEKHLIVYCWNSDVYLQLPCMFIVCRVYMNLRRVTGRECLVWIWRASAV